MKTIAQGAEAIIILNERKNFIIKDRVRKGYRIKELDDSIRKRRARSEAKLLIKASGIINSPKPFLIPEVSYKIKMPFIKGKKLSIHLDNLKNRLKISNQIGQDVGKLHKQNIIHGDLTTSNMILVKDKDFFIDFGLGFISHKIEDKAVDLHLLKQALEAKHFKNHKNLYKEFEKGYKKTNSNEAPKVFERIKAVEKRRRYRH